MKIILLGILFCFSSFYLEAILPNGRTYSTSGEIQAEFQNIFLNMAPKNFEIRTSTPTSLNMEQGQIIILNKNGVISFCTQISTTIYCTQSLIMQR